MGYKFFVFYKDVTVPIKSFCNFILIKIEVIRSKYYELFFSYIYYLRLNSFVFFK
jgi:hypothetical protein